MIPNLETKSSCRKCLFYSFIIFVINFTGGDDTLSMLKVSTFKTALEYFVELFSVINSSS